MTASARERAAEATSTATDEGRHVAGVAKDEARNVASTAADQARSLVDQAKGQVTGQLNDQSRSQRDRLVVTLRTLGDDLERMASQSGASGLATDLAHDVSGRVRAVSDHLDGREPSDLLDDVRRFARRRPGVFLVGALAAGVVTGRFVRGAKEGVEGAAVAADRSATGTAVGGIPPTSATTYPSTYDTGSSYGAGTAGTGYGTTAGESAVDAPTEVHPPMPSTTYGQQTLDAPEERP